MEMEQLEYARYLRVEYSDSATDYPETDTCDICMRRISEQPHLKVEMASGGAYLHVDCARVLCAILGPMAEHLSKIVPLEPQGAP